MMGIDGAGSERVSTAGMAIEALRRCPPPLKNRVVGFGGRLEWKVDERSRRTNAHYQSGETLQAGFTGGLEWPLNDLSESSRHIHRPPEVQTGYWGWVEERSPAHRNTSRAFHLTDADSRNSRNVAARPDPETKFATSNSETEVIFTWA